MKSPLEVYVDGVRLLVDVDDAGSPGFVNEMPRRRDIDVRGMSLEDPQHFEEANEEKILEDPQHFEEANEEKILEAVAEALDAERVNAELDRGGL